MAAYYNEIDPYAAQWLRNLIAAGHIAPGDVDTRSQPQFGGRVSHSVYESVACWTEYPNLLGPHIQFNFASLPIAVVPRLVCHIQHAGFTASLTLVRGIRIAVVETRQGIVRITLRFRSSAVQLRSFWISFVELPRRFGGHRSAASIRAQPFVTLFCGDRKQDTTNTAHMIGDWHVCLALPEPMRFTPACLASSRTKFLGRVAPGQCNTAMDADVFITHAVQCTTNLL